MRQLVIVGVLIALAAASSMAAPTLAPEWRGEPGTVWGEWDTWTGFPGTEFTPMFPDFWGTVPAIDFFPVSQIGAGFDGTPTGSALLDSHAGRDDVLLVDPQDSFVLGLENYTNATPYKRINLRVTYDSAAGAPSGFDVQSLFLGGEEIFPFGGTPKSSEALDGDWVRGTYEFIIAPCPFNEYVFLSFDDPAYIDNVAIDAQCVVPEPVSAAMIGSVALGLTFYRRRKR